MIDKKKSDFFNAIEHWKYSYDYNQIFTNEQGISFIAPTPRLFLTRSGSTCYGFI